MAGMLLDTELAALLAPLPGDPGLAAPLIGEALTRLWLYEDRDTHGLRNLVPSICSSALRKTISEFVALTRHRRRDLSNWDEAKTIYKTQNAIERQAWEWLLERTRSYCEADGLIAVAQMRGSAIREAIALPFNLYRAETNPGVIRDQDGQALGNWIREIKRFKHFLADENTKIVIRAHSGSRTLAGGSFALAILVATQKGGDIADYNPLDVLCTGVIDAGGRLRAVDGLQAKHDLARRLGVRMFVAPGDGVEKPDSLFLPSATPLKECLTLIGTKIESEGIGGLDIHQAHSLIQDLTLEVHEGRIPLERASKRLLRYEAIFLDKPKSPIGKEGTLYAQLLHGAIANHSGDPMLGRRYTKNAAKLAHDFGHSELFVHALASTVVSMTDLGLLDEAEAAGRRLLRWVDQNMQGSALVKIKSRMVALGVLGGQPLLQKGIYDPHAAKESLQLLQGALGCAREARVPKEIARDVVQIALWYALLQSTHADQQIEKAGMILRDLGTDGNISKDYLHQYRFLAAYRTWLQSDCVAAKYWTWPIPETSNWVRALTLKYRGAMNAVAGRNDNAQRDFIEATSILERYGTPLLRFIGATTALQAAESMRGLKTDVWRQYLAQATRGFEALRNVMAGHYRMAEWISRAENVADNTYHQSSNHPALLCRY